MFPNEPICKCHFTPRCGRVARAELHRVRGAFADATEGFSGAEIEQVIVGALYAAFAQGHALLQRDIINEIEETRPLSVTMAERVCQLRAWAADRCVPAD